MGCPATLSAWLDHCEHPAACTPHSCGDAVDVVGPQAWSGESITGPKTITTSQPYERQPMWHRAGISIVVLRMRAIVFSRSDLVIW